MCVCVCVCVLYGVRNDTIKLLNCLINTLCKQILYFYLFPYSQLYDCHSSGGVNSLIKQTNIPVIAFNFHDYES